MKQGGLRIPLDPVRMDGFWTQNSTTGDWAHLNIYAYLPRCSAMSDGLGSHPIISNPHDGNSVFQYRNHHQPHHSFLLLLSHALSIQNLDIITLQNKILMYHIIVSSYMMHLQSGLPTLFCWDGKGSIQGSTDFSTWPSISWFYSSKFPTQT